MKTEKHQKAIGVVLAEAAHGENGKRLTLFTKELGRVTAFANGAKKAKSPLLAGTQLFVFASYELYRGKEAYTLTGAEVIESFYGLRSDLVLTAYAAYLAELSLAFLQDGITGEELLRLIYIGFEELVKADVKPAQIKAAFALKLLALAGYTPELESCVRCGRQEELSYFSVADGGTVCRDSAIKTDDCLPAAVRQAMNYVLTMPEEKLFRFRLKPEYEPEFFALMKKYTDYYLDYPLKSERFLEEIGI